MASIVQSDSPTDRLPQSRRAYEELRRRILEVELPAGEHYLEQELAEMLQMSRTPVREALIRLADEGMVEVRPRRGMRVLPVSANDMREIYEILTSLESTAAEKLAQKGLAPSELASLRQAVADMDRALQDEDLKAWAESDSRFHALLIDYCGNERLQTVVSNFWDQAHRARLVTLSLRPRPTSSNQDHASLINAIAQGDAEAAGRIHRNHRKKSGELLVDLLKKHRLNHV